MESNINTNQKNNKQLLIIGIILGFVLIAFLAILIIVLSNNKNNNNQLNAEQQMIDKLNEVLKQEEKKDHYIPSDILIVCESYGYKIEDLAAKSSEYIYAYDTINNSFMLLNHNYEYSYGIDTTNNNKYDIFIFIKDFNELASANTNGFSTYVKSSYLGKVINTSKGIDVTNCIEEKDINYVNNSSLAQDVLIITNGGDLSIDGKLDNVTHYGSVGNVNIISIAPDSYHECGKPEKVYVSEGHVDLSNADKETVVVVLSGDVKVSRNELVTVIVSTDEEVQIDNVETSQDNKQVENKVVYQILSEKQIEMSKSLNGFGTPDMPFVLEDVKDYEYLNEVEGEIKEYNFIQNKDVTLPEHYNLKKEVTIDLNEHELVTSRELENIKLNNGDLLIGADKHQHDYTKFLVSKDGNHYYECDCGSKVGIESCSGGKADCMNPAVCSKCGNSYGIKNPENHQYMIDGILSIDGYHYHACECGYKNAFETCSGGTANCTNLPICSTCGKTYGVLDLSKHNIEHIAQVDPDYINYGIVEHDHCTLCNKDFINGNVKTITEMQIAKLEDGYIHSVTLQDLKGGTKEEPALYKLNDDLNIGSTRLVIDEDNLILDLNGKTLTSVGAWIQIEGDNVTIINGTIKTNSQIVCNYAGGKQTTTLENCILVATAPRNDGLIVACPGTLNIKNCNVNIPNSTRIIQTYVHSGETSGNEVVVNIYSGNYTSSSFFFNNSVTSTINIYGGTFNKINRVNKNSTINVYGGTFDTDPRYAGYGVTGNTIDTVVDGYQVIQNENNTYTVTK